MEKYHFDSNTKEISISGKKIDFQYSKYKLDSEIDSGANGIVLKGHDSLLDRTVAIKFWLPHRNETFPDYNKLKNEIEKIAQLDSDKIVTIYDANIIEDDYYYAVYEFVQGEPLKEWLKREQDFVSRCFVLDQIYREMEKIHKIKIYHGDLHEGNILIKPNLDVKIIDFGTSFFAKTKEDSHQRETKLLLKTGLLILKEEHTKYNLLETDILEVSPPECVPPSMLMLSDVIQELNRLDNTLDDYGKSRIIFSLAHSICESPFFNLERVIQFLQNSVMDDKQIDLFVGSTSSTCLAGIVEVDNHSIVPMQANKENIDLLKLSYLMWRKKYLEELNTINAADS